MKKTASKNTIQNLLYLLGFMRSGRLLALAGGFFAFVAIVMEIAAAHVLGELTNQLASLDMRTVHFHALILLVLFVGALIGHYIEGYFLARLGNIAAYNLRLEVSKKIFWLPLSYFQTHLRGEITSRVSNAIDNITQMLHHNLRTVFSAALTIVCVAIAMLFSSWQLALAALITAPIGVLALGLIAWQSNRFFKRQQMVIGTVNGYAERTYSSASVIRAYNYGEQNAQQFATVNKRFARATQLAQFTSGLSVPLIALLSNVGFIFVCIVGIWLNANGMIQGAGVLVVFFVFVRLFQSALSQLASALGSMLSALASAERVFAMLGEQEADREQGEYQAIANGDIRFDNVTFGYDGERLLDRMSFCIQKGQKVAIVGKCGSGKTTIVDLLLRMQSPDSGSILIGETNIASASRQDVRDLFSLATSEGWLFDGTIAQNLAPLRDTFNVLSDEQAQLVALLGVDHMVGTIGGGLDRVVNGDALSDGQRQLIGLARAVLDPAPILIIDEAMSALTPSTLSALLDALPQKTVILLSSITPKITLEKIINI